MRMTNAAAIYAITVLVFVAGLWVILAFGSTFQAQPDLAGEWELSPERGGGQESVRATIEQSGRYVRIRLNDQQYNLRINSSAGRIEMSGHGAGATFEPSPSPSHFRVTLAPANGEPRRFSGRFVNRAHPRESVADKSLQSKSARTKAPATNAH